MTDINLGGSILFCLVGPTGSGKSSICSRLLDIDPRLTLSISATSRNPRGAEVPGQHYHFYSKDNFESLITRQEFFEWELVHGNYYGTLKSTLTSAAEAGKDLLLDIDIRGALNFRKHFPGNTVLLFMVPPSLDILLARIKNRTEVSRSEILNRLKTAVQEFFTFEKHYGDFDYLLINDDFEVAVNTTEGVIAAERLRIDRRFTRVSGLVSGFINSINVELARG